MYAAESVRRGLMSSGLTPQSMFPLPGLKQTVSWHGPSRTFRMSAGFIPQGICVAGDYLLVTAYDSNPADNKSLLLNSVIYVLEPSTGAYITTIAAHGKSHVGGICFDNDRKFIWYSNGTAVAGFSYDTLCGIVKDCRDDKSGEAAAYRLVSAEKHFSVLKQSSFLAYFDGLLWVGTFNSKGTGEIFGYSYELSDSEARPVFEMQAPSKAQGMFFYRREKEVYLAVSCSYGLMTSTVRLYKISYPASGRKASVVKIIKHDAYEVLKFPHGLENIAVNGNRVYIMFESAKVMTKYPLNKVDRIVKYKLRDFLHI